MSFGAPAGVETLSIPHMLELIGVSHSGPIVPNKTSCWSRVTGSVASGLILKDISCEVNKPLLIYKVREGLESLQSSNK